MEVVTKDFSSPMMEGKQTYDMKKRCHEEEVKKKKDVMSRQGATKGVNASSQRGKHGAKLTHQQSQ